MVKSSSGTLHNDRFCCPSYLPARVPLWIKLYSFLEVRNLGLDNLLWDRRFAEELFDSYYQWEVYKPVAERRYGYYVLPILYGDRFVARFEPGRDKKSRALIIKNWWWESGVTPSKRMQSDLLRCFKRFLTYLGTDNFQIDSKTAEQAGSDWPTTLCPGWHTLSQVQLKK